MNSILYFDVAAMVILLFFLVLMPTRNQIVNRTNRILYMLMIMIFLSTAMDLFSGVLEDIDTANRGVIAITYLTNAFFFVVHNMLLPLLLLYLYSSTDVWHLFKSKRTLIALWLTGVIIPEIALMCNVWLLDVFSMSSHNDYVRGPWIIVFYLVAACFIVWILVFVVKYQKLINKDKNIVFLFSLLVTLTGIMIQAMNSNLNVEMFATTIGLLFFMVVAKRSETLIDPISGALKYVSGVERINSNFMTRKPIVLVLVRVVNFRNIRLYLGQEHYTLFLNMTTELIKSKSRAHNYEGDLFYLDTGLYALLAEDTDVDHARGIAEELKQEFAKEWQVGDFKVRPDVCMCIVRCPDEVSDFSTLFTLAQTFHNTMPDSRNIAMFADYREDKSFLMKNEMDDIISRGLKNKSFEMYYQPIYSIENDRCISAEALIRLKDEKYGFVSPGLFIPIAELNGMIHEIGDYVLEAVARFISTTDMDAIGLKYVQINLSAAQCIEVDLVEKITTLFEDYGVSPDQVCFEITETVADVNPVIVDMNVHKLHEYGFRFSLDDYGTGYSNIKRVTSLPIDQVKLDKSFVDEIDSPYMWDVIRDTVDMLKKIGKEVLIEGVETDEVAQRFKNMQCDYFQGCQLIQGYYYCKPLSESDFIKFLEG